MVCTNNFLLCKAALIFGVTKWVFSWAKRLVKHCMLIFSWSLEFNQEPPANSAQSSTSTLRPSPSSIAIVKDHLSLTTFQDISKRRLPNDDRESSRHDMSCVVCLRRFKKKDRVWELRNCSHVFHEECLNRWLLYDSRLSCPLCRTSLMAMSSESSSSPASLPQQPSWAVERILYLFGDDLFCSPSYSSSSSSSAVEDQTYSCLLPCYSP